MSKLDRALMIIELVAGFMMLIFGVLMDSWIIGWCSVVCVISGFFIGVWSELSELWKAQRKQTELYQDFLQGIVDICQKVTKEKETESQQGESSGSSSGS